ncbi:uncharacterized protein LOC112568298 [Pomacea canaliculata]|uniref:uncharacterized protein LOC112568298 n=1 Tax=Pomacea canaliculata TaxID=400727 RepID=UPI000D72F59E|nr:uncharacterized protein LOC112568298 [Pomacea canaliculata]
MTTEDEYQHFKIIRICVIMMLFYQAQGQEYECEVEFTGKCITKVRSEIPEKYAQRKTPFTVSYVSSEGKTEIAVLLHYLGGYVCETAGDHVCDDSDNTISIIRNSVTTCVSNRTYILAADGDDGVVCMPTQNETDSTGSHPGNRKHRDTCCGNDTFHANESVIGIVVGIACAVSIIFLLILFSVALFRMRSGRWRSIKQRKATPADPQRVLVDTKGLV